MNKNINYTQKLYSNEELNQILKQYKTSLLASITHGIKTPLNSGTIMMHILKTQDQVPKYIQDNYIYPAFCSNEILNSIISDYQDLVHMETQTLVLDFAEFNLVNLIQQTVMLFAFQSSEKKINISIDINDFIDQNESEEIISDMLRVKQILINLLSNSIKYQEKGEILLKLNYDCNNKIAIIEVIDQGYGISQNIINKILQGNFDQDVKVNEDNRGLGIGLVFCHEMAKILNKFSSGLEISSEEGKGTTVKFTVQNQQMRCKHKTVQIFNKDFIDDFIEQDISIKLSQNYLKYSYKTVRQIPYDFINSEMEQSYDIQARVKQKTCIQERSQNLTSSIDKFQSKVQSNRFEDRSQLLFLNYKPGQSLEYENLKKSNQISKQKTFSQKQLQVADSNYSKQNSPKKFVDNNFKLKNQKLQSNSILENNKQNLSISSNFVNFKKKESHYFNIDKNQGFVGTPKSKQKQNDILEIQSNILKSNNYNSLICSNMQEIDKIQQNNQQVNDNSFIQLTNIHDTDRNLKSQDYEFENYYYLESNRDYKAQQIRVQQSAKIDINKKNKLQNEELDLNQIQEFQIKINDFKCKNDSQYQYQQQQQNKKVVFKREKIEQECIIDIDQQLNEDNNNQKEIQQECTCSDILIVDDDLFNLNAVSTIINNRHKFKVDKAVNGQQAVDKVIQIYNKQCCLCYKLIIMDIDMPIMNGFEASVNIFNFYQKQENLNDKIHYICSHTAFNDKIKLNQLIKDKIITHSLQKPFSIQEIDNLISLIQN